MKTLHRYVVALSCLLLISTAPLIAGAQETAPAPQPPVSEVESLRRQVEEQKALIQKLQSNVAQQSQALEKQQSLLETLLLKIEQLDAAAPDARMIKASATVPAPAAEVSDVREPANNSQAAPAAKKPEERPKVFESGYGKIKFNGLFQGWFAAGNGSFRDTFRIRRV